MFGTQTSSMRVVLVAFVTALVVAAGAAAQTGWKQGRTPDGQPDLQGIWLNFDSTPFESPTAQPAAAAAGSTAATNVGPASEFADHNHKVSERRRAMVIDPPDGRVPVMKWAEDKRDYDLAHIPDAPEHETPWVRCITRGYPAAFFPAGYNNAYEIIQTPGYVVIVFEMIHETRIIPIDGRPKLGANIKQWNGEPRGRWEGNTLVVESTNYNSKGSIGTSAATGRMRGIPQSDAMKVTERFTRIDANTINYTVTIDGPEGLHQAVDRVAAPESRRLVSDVRVLVSGGELRDGQRAQLRPQARRRGCHRQTELEVAARSRIDDGAAAQSVSPFLRYP